MKPLIRRLDSRVRVTLTAVLVLCLAACAGTASNERFYQLAPVVVPAVAAGQPAPWADRDLVVTVAAIPDSVDRPQLVRKRGPYEIEVLDFDRWIEPVRSGVTTCLARELQLALPGASWAAAATNSLRNPVLISITIVTMEAGPGGSVRLSANWRLTQPGTAGSVTGALALDRVAAVRPELMVATWSEELGALAVAIARDVSALPAR